jgi:outer membrane lipoprotein-sorting protein
MSVLRFFLIVLVATTLVSCGASSRSTQSDASDSVDQFEDSGKRISGEFIASVEDTYRTSGSRAQRQATLSFDEDGHFKRQVDSRIEEGSYLITTSNEMIMYIEKLNGEFLTAAKPERYHIDEQSDASIILTGPSRNLLLKKK